MDVTGLDWNWTAQDRFIDGRCYSRTSCLRWAYGNDDNDPVLQQLWVSFGGEDIWEDVPSIPLPSPSQPPSQHSDKE